MKGAISEDRPAESVGALVRVGSKSSSISYTVELVHVDHFVRFAQIAVENAVSERELANFVRSQIDSRDPVIEAAIEASHPGYTQDVSRKIVMFTLALAFVRADVAQHLRFGLMNSDCIVDIRLDASDLHVCLKGGCADYEVAFLFDDPILDPSKLN